MKALTTAALVLCISVIYAQNETTIPIEERHPVNYWWWVLGVLLAIGVGIGIYMLIKKDPRRDAVD